MSKTVGYSCILMIVNVHVIKHYTCHNNLHNEIALMIDKYIRRDQHLPLVFLNRVSFIYVRDLTH